MAPVWPTVVAWLYLGVCFCCAGNIAYDVVVNRRRQSMAAMNLVFPITALYFGPFAFALALYGRWGRAAARRTRVASSPPAMSHEAMASATTLRRCTTTTSPIA